MLRGSPSGSSAFGICGAAPGRLRTSKETYLPCCMADKSHRFKRRQTKHTLAPGCWQALHFNVPITPLSHMRILPYPDWVVKRFFRFFVDFFIKGRVSRILFWGSVSGAGTLRPAKSAKCMKKEGKTRLRLRQLPSFFITQIPQA